MLRRCVLLLEDLDAVFTGGITSAADPTTNTNGGPALSLSGLLTTLDWVDPAEGRCVTVSISAAFDFANPTLPFSGRLVFVTTNHVERLDPALTRHGRMDVWVNFTHATKWQAESLFKLFFSSRPSASSPNESPSLGASRENLTRTGRRESANAVPVLEEAEIVQLAHRFSSAIPEGKMSVWPILS